MRVIASSNRDLPAEIEAGRFRQDLFYRLSVVPMRVPPLTERREDIPLLARHFMMRSAETAGPAAREYGEDAMAALQAYDWPGNVRQLRNIVELAADHGARRADDPIRADMLPPEIGANTPAGSNGIRSAARSWACRCAKRARCSSASTCWPR